MPKVDTVAHGVKDVVKDAKDITDEVGNTGELEDQAQKLLDTFIMAHLLASVEVAENQVCYTILE